MERAIDNVMLHSQRIDERSRLIARLADLVTPYVRAALDDGVDPRPVLRGAVVAAVRTRASTPFALVAEALAVAAAVTDHPALGPRSVPAADQRLAVGLIDGLGLAADDVGVALGVVADDVEAAHAAGRESLGLPPPPLGCGSRDRGRPHHRHTCADCMLTAVDRRAAIDRIAPDEWPQGPMIELLARRARARSHSHDAPMVHGGPEPFVAVVGQP